MKSCSNELGLIHTGETMVLIEGNLFTFTVHELYTARACDELAVALADCISDSSVIQVRTAGNWPGGYLLHAGVFRDDLVYDIEGVHEVDEWIDRWGRGMDIEVHFRHPRDEQHTFADEGSRIFAERIAIELLAVPEFEEARQSLLAL